MAPSFTGPADHRLFVVEFIPSEAVKRQISIIVAPPFAEEMNRCRRMVYEQARALAENGIRVIVTDLYGTGDSSGEFGDARWEIWCENLSQIARGISEQAERYGILAIRLGALLAFDSRTDIVAGADRVVLWNPCLSGPAYLRQFLRLRIASQIAGGEREKESLADLLTAFKLGRTLEIAGYETAPELALAIQSSSLEPAHIPQSLPITWYDVVSKPESGVAEATAGTVRQWRESGCDVQVEPVRGDPFWATVEITIAPELIAKTTATFGEM